MWRRGQRQVAARMARQLADQMVRMKAAAAGPPPASAAPGALAGALRAATAAQMAPHPMRLATALSLAGQWALEAQLSDFEGLGGVRAGAGGSSGGGAPPPNPVLSCMNEASMIVVKEMEKQSHQASTSSAGGGTSAGGAGGGTSTGGMGGGSSTARAGGQYDISGTGCKILYRLAAYADKLYRELVAQRQSPEYSIAGEVIKVREGE